MSSAATSFAARHGLSSPPRQSSLAAMPSRGAPPRRPQRRPPSSRTDTKRCRERNSRRRCTRTVSELSSTLSKKIQRLAPQLAPPARQRPCLGAALPLQNSEFRIQRRVWVRFLPQSRQNSEFRVQRTAVLRTELCGAKEKQFTPFRIQRRFFSRAEFRVRRRGGAEFHG